MSRFFHWAALGLLCAAFGFAGAFGAVWVASDHLQGPEGRVGPRGEPGAKGPVGAAPDQEVLTAVLTNLDRRLRTVEGLDHSMNLRLAAVETRELTVFLCGPEGIDVVTGVEVIPGLPQLAVDSERLCLG